MSGYAYRYSHDFSKLRIPRYLQASSPNSEILYSTLSSAVPESMERILRAMIDD
jgi:hypothetical protein